MLLINGLKIYKEKIIEIGKSTVIMEDSHALLLRQVGKNESGEFISWALAESDATLRGGEERELN